jgi:hypothetical protein
MKNVYAIFIVALAAMTAACHGKNTNVVSPGNTVQSIEISGKTSIVVGENSQLTATATFADGTKKDVTQLATWKSLMANVPVSATGVVTGLKATECGITATYDNVTGQVAISITAGQGVVEGGGGGGDNGGGGGGGNNGGGGDDPSATVQSLTLSGNSTVAVGQVSQLTATAHMSNGTTKNVTGQATWTSSAPATATVSSGLLTGVAIGTSTITAALNGKSAQTTATVQAGPPTAPSVQSLSISGNPSVTVGQTSQLTVTAHLSDGTTVNVTGDAVWASDAPGTATAPGGLLTGIAAGNANISAAYGGKTVQVPVTVQPAVAQAQLIGIEVSLDANILGGGSTQANVRTLGSVTAPLNLTNLLQDPILDLHVAGVYSDGTKQDVTSSAAITSPDQLLQINGGGVINLASTLIQALIDPNHVINVSYGGFSASVTLHINVPVLGDLGIQGLQLQGISPNADLAVGTHLPAVLATLANGQLLIPSATAGLNWNMTPTGLLPTLLSTLGKTLNNVVGIAGGTVQGQGLDLGILDPLHLLGGKLPVDLSSTVGGVTATTVPVKIPL